MLPLCWLSAVSYHLYQPYLADCTPHIVPAKKRPNYELKSAPQSNLISIYVRLALFCCCICLICMYKIRNKCISCILYLTLPLKFNPEYLINLILLSLYMFCFCFSCKPTVDNSFEIFILWLWLTMFLKLTLWLDPVKPCTTRLHVGTSQPHYSVNIHRVD